MEFKHLSIEDNDSPANNNYAITRQESDISPRVLISQVYLPVFSDPKFSSNSLSVT